MMRVVLFSFSFLISTSRSPRFFALTPPPPPPPPFRLFRPSHRVIRCVNVGILNTENQDILLEIYVS